MRTRLLCLLVVWSPAVSPARGQFVSGSDGSDGPLNITSNAVVDLALAATGTWDTPSPVPGRGVYDPVQWAVVFKYTTIDVAPGARVTFLNHPSGAPVVWLATGDVTIFGEVNLDGEDGVTTQTAATLGSLTATKEHCNGGTYTSILNVQPRFTFTKMLDPAQVRVLDTGVEGIAPVTLIQNTAAPWTWLTWPSSTRASPGRSDSPSRSAAGSVACRAGSAAMPASHSPTSPRSSAASRAERGIVTQSSRLPDARRLRACLRGAFPVPSRDREGAVSCWKVGPLPHGRGSVGMVRCLRHLAASASWPASGSARCQAA